MVKKTTKEENKKIMSSKIATDTAEYLAKGGAIGHYTHVDNAGYAGDARLVTKSRKQEAANLKKRRNFNLKPQDKGACTKNI